MSAFEPTSTPWVGSSSTSTCGATRSQRAMTTFCWLPPDSSVMSVSGSPGPDVELARSTARPPPAPRRLAGGPPRQNADRSAIVRFSRTDAVGQHAPGAARSAGTQHTPGVDRRAGLAGGRRVRPSTSTVAARGESPGQQPGDLLAARPGQAGDAEHLAGAHRRGRARARRLPRSPPPEQRGPRRSCWSWLRTCCGVVVERAAGRASARRASRGTARPTSAVATLRPSRRTVTRSHRPSTSSRWWEMNRMLDAPVGDAAQRQRTAGRPRGRAATPSARRARAAAPCSQSSSARATATAVRSDSAERPTTIASGRCRSRALEALGDAGALARPGRAGPAPDAAALETEVVRDGHALDRGRGSGGRSAARPAARRPASRGRTGLPDDHLTWRRGPARGSRRGTFTSVDLPQPLGPTRAWISPARDLEVDVVEGALPRERLAQVRTRQPPRRRAPASEHRAGPPTRGCSRHRCSSTVRVADQGSAMPS